jgi:hypothetical protein
MRGSVTNAQKNAASASMQRGAAYGICEGRMMLDGRDRKPYTGAEFPVPPIVNPRIAAFTLPAPSTAEART